VPNSPPGASDDWETGTGADKKIVAEQEPPLLPELVVCLRVDNYGNGLRHQLRYAGPATVSAAGALSGRQMGRINGTMSGSPPNRGVVRITREMTFV